LNLSKLKLYCEELVVFTGVLDTGNVVVLPANRITESLVAQSKDILVNKCSCNPETELSKLFCKFVVKLLGPDSKFLFDLPKLKLFTKRVLRSLVSNDVPADFRSLKRGDKLSFENLVEKFVTGDAESISCFELFSMDQLVLMKVFLFHF
jgi:hypothetical protein